MKLNTTLFLITGTLLAVSNFLALKLFLYWRYSWIDMPVHFLGGVAAALGLFVLFDFRLPLPRQLLSLSYFMFLVFFVAVAWEIFEVLLGAVDTTTSYYISDTVTDMICGLFGGLVGFFVGSKMHELDNLI